MKKTRWTLLLIIIAAVTGTVIWRAKARSQQAPPSAGGRATAVTTAEVAAKDVPIHLSGIGTVQAYNTVTVRPRVSGTLDQVNFTEGSLVKAGDVLAQIDPRPYQSALAQARAKKAQDEAQLANARLDLARLESLKKGSASEQQTDVARAAVAQFAAMVQADQAALDSAQLDLDFTTVRAPISGRTGVRLLDAGNVVTASQTEGLVVLAQLQPISVIFTLPQRYLASLRPHMQPGAPLLNAEAIGDDNEVLDIGKVELIDNQIEASTGTLRLKATFPNDKFTLWPGQYVTVRTLTDTLKSALVVPAEVVQPGIDGTFAWLVKADKTVEVRPVKTGPTIDGVTVIEEGLKAGERVVRNGQSKLKSGVPVAAKDAPAR